MYELQLIPVANSWTPFAVQLHRNFRLSRGCKGGRSDFSQWPCHPESSFSFHCTHFSFCLRRTNQRQFGRLKRRHLSIVFLLGEMQRPYRTNMTLFCWPWPVMYFDLGIQKLNPLGYKLEYFSYSALGCHQLPQQAVSSKGSWRKNIHHALHTNKAVGSHLNARRKY